MSKMKYLCEYCGKQFWADKREINRGNREFYSPSCGTAFGNEKRGSRSYCIS